MGYVADTAQLGGEDNFAVAGHRRTHGDPFKDFPRLGRGDAVVLTDGTTWFTYRIDRDPYKTVPTDIEVIDPCHVLPGTRVRAATYRPRRRAHRNGTPRPTRWATGSASGEAETGGVAPLVW
ncbi:hypothetical protein SHIRM173S_09649 [Streptomyces hirsutus]